MGDKDQDGAAGRRLNTLRGDGIPHSRKPIRRDYLLGIASLTALSGCAGGEENGNAEEDNDPESETVDEEAETAADNNSESKTGDDAEPENETDVDNVDENQFGEPHELTPHEVEITADDAWYTDEVTDTDSTRQADGIFVVVQFTLQNIGDDPIEITTDWFQLVNESDQVYEPIQDATELLDQGIRSVELQPRVETERSVVFEVPDDDTAEWRLRFIGYGGEYFSQNYIDIHLGQLEHRNTA